MNTQPHSERVVGAQAVAFPVSPSIFHTPVCPDDGMNSSFNHNDDDNMENNGINGFTEGKKSSLTLDFNGNNSRSQKFYFNGTPATTPAFLDSTDLNKFNMTTPEVEHYLLNQSMERPEERATDVRVKNETRSESPVDDVREDMKALNVDTCTRPVDMDEQEAIKLERKRLRNRIAASKCRKRKLEKIARLEDKVRNIKGENGELAAAITRLKDHVMSLKQDLIDHVKHGCVISGFSSCG